MLDEIKLKKLFGKRLRLIRKSLGLTQEKLSEIADLDPQHYCKIETGSYFPSSKTLVKIANTLKIDISDLFSSMDKQENIILEKILIDVKQLSQEKLLLLIPFVDALKTLKDRE